MTTGFNLIAEAISNINSGNVPKETRSAPAVKATRPVGETERNKILSDAFLAAKRQFERAGQQLPDNLKDQYSVLFSAAAPQIVHKMLCNGHTESDIRLSLGYDSVSNDTWKPVFEPGLDLYRRTIAKSVSGLKPPAERTVVVDGKTIDVYDAMLDAVTTGLFQKKPEPVIVRLRGRKNPKYNAWDLVGCTADQWAAKRQAAAKQLATAGLRTRSAKKEPAPIQTSSAVLTMIQAAIAGAPAADTADAE